MGANCQTKLHGPDPSVAGRCIRCGKSHKNKWFCSKKCEKLWRKK